MSHVAVGLGYGTSVQIAGYTPASGIPYEPIWDTTNQRIVVFQTTIGDYIPMASEAYVLAQVAALSAGISSNLLLAASCT
jgi:hypothetical protein